MGGDQGEGAAAGSPPPQNVKPWHELRQWGDPLALSHLLKSGYNQAADPGAALELALKGEAAAVSKLGKAPGSLLDAPAKDQSPLDWLKANAKAFGVPEDAAKYDLALPKDLPEGVPLDEALLADAKVFGHQNGLPPGLMQSMVDFYGQKVGARVSAMATEAVNAETKIKDSLVADWGQNYAQNLDMAKRAFHTLAAEMKLPPDAARLTASMLEQGLGSAALTKFMHHIAGKMGEDTLAMPKGGNGALMQLGQAQSRKEQIMAAMTGDMAMALQSGNITRLSELKAELTGLNTIIAQHQS